MGTPKIKKNESKQDYLKRCTESRMADGEDRRTAFSRCAARLSADADGMVLEAPVQMLEAGEDKARGFLIIAKTGDPVGQWGWTTAIDIDGIETEAKMPILREHMRDRVVGYGHAFKDGDKLMVEGDFSQVTADGKEVLALADEGYPWQASIGVWAREYKTIEAGEIASVNGQEIKGPADIWTKSYVREVSFVTLGADERTAAIALADEHTASINPKHEVKPMNFETLKTDHPDLVEQILSQGREAGRAEGIEQERGRVVEILNADADLAQTKTAIADGTPSGEAYKAFFEAEKAKRADGLKQLANEATTPQGQGHDGDDTNPDAGLSADVIVSRRAKALADEKGLSYEAACSQVLRGDPELKAKYRAMYSAD